MNDYDDSEDYSSANSFRARSNTWPLNRPDLAVPNGVCIDETLPEIELEEDDLFTTNDNWTTGLDHDIMSWDPILNAQGQHHQHHHQQQHNHPHHQQGAPSAANYSSSNNHSSSNNNSNSNNNNNNNNNTTTSSSTNQHHHQPTTVHHHHQPLQQQQPQPNLSSHQPHQQPHHEPLLVGSSVMLGGQVQPQQIQPQHQPPSGHQTLNNSHCLDVDDPNEYHIQQLHYLRLDNNNQAPLSAADHQQHYISPLSSVCIQGVAQALGNESYNVSLDHQQHHHLQPLTSARYDLDQQGDIDSKLNDLDHHQQQHQHPHQQLHRLNSSSLDHHSSANSTHMLSSSLSTSGIGLSGDLEDLDYKAVDPSSILQHPHFDEQLPRDQHHHQASDLGGSLMKQSNSTTSSKTKLNTPRRNAWGNMSYADLISQAINSTNDKRLTLSQIYDWMVQHVPYFKDKGDSNSSAGWKNSVRHNLSLHNRFKRLQNEGAGKSSWWTINPEANVGKCARRRAASMEASKYEKKRGRAKKRAEAIRQGLMSYPSLNSSLNGSAGNLEQLHHLQSSTQFGSQTQQQQPQLQQTQQQQTDGLTSDKLQNSSGLYSSASSSSQKSQFKQKDNEMPQQQQLSQSPPTTSPPLQAAPQPQQQQPQQQLPEQPQQIQNQVQQQQVHHQMQKMEQHETDSYYIQHHHDLHQDQFHHQSQHQQILNSNDHMDLFGRHAIYMSEPCNDCNCTELINCGTNAMSFT